MDSLVLSTPSLSGSCLTVQGGTISFVENTDNLIRREHSYSADSYPYGMTWTPGTPGNYLIYATAVDQVSGNRVMSQPVSISATAGTGELPEIKLNRVESPVFYDADGAGPAVNLAAEVYDRDGKIVEVQFYVNGNNIGTDTTSPFEGNYTINRSGVYDFYAVVSDDNGNDVTSTVQRL